MTVHQPGDFPSRAEPGNYLRSAAALEAVSRFTAAEQAYAAATARWPDNATGWIGLGNAHYQQDRFDDAETAYREALRLDEGSAAANHNLAWALIRQHRHVEAFPVARRAAAMADDGRDHYRAALSHLESIDNHHNLQE
jgi:tetratricopeptide (TPR) repeat protein